MVIPASNDDILFLAQQFESFCIDYRKMQERIKGKFPQSVRLYSAENIFICLSNISLGFGIAATVVAIAALVSCIALGAFGALNPYTLLFLAMAVTFTVIHFSCESYADTLKKEVDQEYSNLFNPPLTNREKEKFRAMIRAHVMVKELFYKQDSVTFVL